MIPVHIDLGPDSLRVCAASGPDTPAFERGRACDVAPEWGTVGRLAATGCQGMGNQPFTQKATGVSPAY